MNVRHHPEPSTLISYAAGTLPGAIAGVVACHASVCYVCRDSVRTLEALGGLMLERLEPPGAGRVEDDTIARQTLTRDLSAFSPDAESAAAARVDPILPAPLVRYLGMGSHEIPWKSLPRGIMQYWVKLPPGAGLMRLLKVPPWTRLLEHSHRGHEATMILTGSYTDETGRYCAGDVCEMHKGMEHRPGNADEEECICIIASEKQPRYSKFYARLLRPLLGF